MATTLVCAATAMHGYHRSCLWKALINRTPVGIALANDYMVATGLVQAIEAEDGSGFSFNVTVTGKCEDTGRDTTWKVYLRCKQ